MSFFHFAQFTQFFKHFFVYFLLFHFTFDTFYFLVYDINVNIYNRQYYIFYITVKEFCRLIAYLQTKRHE